MVRNSHFLYKWSILTVWLRVRGELGEFVYREDKFFVSDRAASDTIPISILWFSRVTTSDSGCTYSVNLFFPFLKIKWLWAQFICIFIYVSSINVFYLSWKTKYNYLVTLIWFNWWIKTPVLNVNTTVKQSWTAVLSGSKDHKTYAIYLADLGLVGLLLLKIWIILVRASIVLILFFLIRVDE